ncbi:sterol desaturase family protein [bacterium]|nr:sterol desaturase family protein [bacterium]
MWDTESTGGLRLGIFLALFGTLTIAESLFPRRRWQQNRYRRWGTHLALLTINTLLTRLLIPITAVGAAIHAETYSIGLLHLIDWPPTIEIGLALVLLDLTIYGQHVLFHHVPWLWRLHRVHHADLDFDVTTGLRFHALEILLSAGIKIGGVMLLGAPPVAVLFFEVILNAGAMFSHSNLTLPVGFDRRLRWLIVTPDMHRVHHSIVREETNSNYGFHLSCWDFLFQTYRAQPAAGHVAMTIGLENFREERQVSRLGGICMLPWTAAALPPHPTDQSTPETHPQ